MRDYEALTKTINYERERRRELLRYSTQHDEGQCDLCGHDDHLVNGLCPDCVTKCTVKGEK